jgi:hypothetical protein
VPERAQKALEFKTIVQEWGINPWEMDKLTAKDLQEIRLAEHAETYIQQEQRARQGSGSNLSANYDMNKSRQEAFG